MQTWRRRRPPRSPGAGEPAARLEHPARCPHRPPGLDLLERGLVQETKARGWRGQRASRCLKGGGCLRFPRAAALVCAGDAERGRGVTVVTAQVRVPRLRRGR